MIGIARNAVAVVAVAASVFAHAPAAAQLNDVGFRLGLSRANAGGGFTDFVRDLGYESESRTGFVAGAYVDYGLALLDNRFSVQAGLDIAQRGNRIARDDGTTYQALDVTYIDVPVLGKATFGNGALRYHALAGPVLSFKQSAELERDGERRAANDVVGTDLGLAVGVGGRRGRLGLELRYVLGMSNINEDPDPDESVKNRQWALVATYEIPIWR